MQVMPYKSILALQITRFGLIGSFPFLHVSVQQVFELSELVDEHHEHG